MNQIEPKTIFVSQFPRDKPEKDFSSIEKLIRLPPLRKLTQEESPFPQSDQQLLQNQDMSDKLKKNIIEQRELLRDEFCQYENSPSFEFYLPESKFPSIPKGQINNISYEKKNIVEQQNTFRNRLSEEQIQEIKQKGQFKVKSTKQWIRIPYIWQLNDTIFKGIIRVYKDWNQRLSVIHSFCIETWHMLIQQFPKELIRILKFPCNLFKLLMGKKSMRVCYSVDFNREIAKDFWNEVMKQSYIQCKEWSSQLWKFMDTRFFAQIYMPSLIANPPMGIGSEMELRRKQHEQRKQMKIEKIKMIDEISIRFQENWKKIGKKVLNQVQKSITSKFQNYEDNPSLSKEEKEMKKKEKQRQILQRLSQEEFTSYTNFLSQELPKNNIPPQVIEAILTLLILLNITGRKMRLFNFQRQSSKEKIQKQIIKKYPVRSLTSQWYVDQVNQEFIPLQQQLKQQFYNSFIDSQLASKLNLKQKEVYKLWLQYIKNYQIKIQQKKEQKFDLYEPERVFQSTYRLLPPYRILRSQSNPSYYQIIKSKQIQATTASHCWKFMLYCTRLKAWTINCLVVLFYLVWKGKFGVRCLCGVQEFSYDQDVNVMTGEIVDSMRKPVLGQFMTVMDGISKSRAAFEALPDTGLFGKTCSRVCNLIECYLFRFFIVGVLIILTLYPIAIIFSSVVCFFLITTIWIWVPILTIVFYMFNIFIFQLDASKPYLECYVRLAPFLGLVFRILFSICKALFFIVSFFVITPLVALIVFLYACVCFCVRSFSDSIVLCFIRCCGHTPSTDSVFATKISGPNTALKEFMSINEEDLYILVQAQLEQIHLQQVSRITLQKINQPYDRFKRTIKTILQSLLNEKNSTNSYSYPNWDSNNSISNSTQLIVSKFNEDYSQFKVRYPRRPSNVRFTQEQLTQFFQNSQQIVRTYVFRNKLDKWIFLQFGTIQNDYEELTRKIWIELFQCGEEIFQPLEQIDQRFRLQDQYKGQQNSYQYSEFPYISYEKMRINVNQISLAIKGQVNLKSKKIGKVTTINPQLFNRRIEIFKTKPMFNLMNSNSDQNVNFDLNQPSFLFFPHLAIREVIKLQQYEYAQRREENIKNSQKW